MTKPVMGRNVIGRKPSKESLQESQKKYQTLMDESIDAIFVTDTDGNLLEVNKKAEQLTGYSKRELLNMHFTMLHPREVAEEVADAFRKGLQEVTSSYMELPLTRKDGSTIYVDLVGKIIECSGRKLGQAIVRDISERKRIENALKESEHRFRQLSENIREIFWLTDPDGKEVLYVSPMYEEIWGRSCESLYKDPRAFLDSIHPEDRERVVASFERRKNGETLNIEYRILREDGSVRQIRSRAFPIADKEGRIYRIAGISEDVTESKFTEDAVRQSEARLKVLFRHAPVSLWEEDFTEIKRYIDGLRNSGVDDFRAYFEGHIEEAAKCFEMVKVVDVNEASVKLYKADSKEDLMEKLGKIVTGETILAFREALIAVAEGRSSFETENSNRTLNGDTIHVILKWLVPPGYEETCSRVLVSVVDITERKLSEKKILAYQSALRSLASGLSLMEERERRCIAADLHDNIGQTLAISRIKLGALREAAFSSEQIREIDEVRKYIEQAIQYARSLTSELSPSVLYELGLEAAVESLTEQIQKSCGISFNIDIDDTPKPLDEDVRILLFKAVRELFVNIVKHAKARRADISIKRDADWVQILVRDDGVGFEASELKPHSEKGFGLFNVRERLESIGGFFDIASQPGQGTVASIVAPLMTEREVRG